MDVFNRRENKYLIEDEELFMKLWERLSVLMPADDRSSKRSAGYVITNLYYDTADSILIRTSLSKPVYREKLRIRAYDIPSTASEVYIEIKKKVSGVVNKRRVAMKLAEAYNFLETGTATNPEIYRNTLVPDEIKTILERYPLKPALYLSYDRLALGETDCDGVRITFDSDLTTRRTDLRLESGSYGQKLLPEGVRIMEIKVRYNMPLWLSRLLCEYKIYPTSFSKYGTEYKKMLEQKEEKTLFILPAMVRGINGAIPRGHCKYGERTAHNA